MRSSALRLIGYFEDQQTNNVSLGAHRGTMPAGANQTWIGDNERAPMQITLELPDEIARQLSVGQDLSRAALEGLVAEGCRTHRLSEHQAAELLGIDGYTLDGFLKAHGVFLDYSVEDFDREIKQSERLWQQRQAKLDGEHELPDR